MQTYILVGVYIRGEEKWEIVVVPAFDGGRFRSSAADLFVGLIWAKVKRKETQNI